MMNKSDAAVSIRGLRVRRGKHRVFDGFDLDLRTGSITGLLGPSGCGKTTLMRAIVGAQRIESGDVRVLGEDAGSRGLRRRVSYSTQAASVYDDLSIAQNLAYFARVTGAPRGDVDRVLEVVELRSHAKQRVADLSGGQRSRVSLGVAMLGSPELIVLDEPTVGLDPLLRDGLWTTFRALADTGVTLIVSSHVMDEAVRCDDVVLLRSGRLIAHVTPAEMLERTGTTDPDAAFLELIHRAGSTRRDLAEES